MPARSRRDRSKDRSLSRSPMGRCRRRSPVRGYRGRPTPRDQDRGRGRDRSRDRRDRSRDRGRPSRRRSPSSRPARSRSRDHDRDYRRGRGGRRSWSHSPRCRRRSRSPVRGYRGRPAPRDQDRGRGRNRPQDRRDRSRDRGRPSRRRSPLSRPARSRSRDRDRDYRRGKGSGQSRSCSPWGCRRKSPVRGYHGRPAPRDQDRGRGRDRSRDRCDRSRDRARPSRRRSPSSSSSSSSLSGSSRSSSSQSSSACSASQSPASAKASPKKEPVKEVPPAVPPLKKNDLSGNITEELLQGCTNLKQWLACPICPERFTQPRILPCFHSFCHDCLNKFPTAAQDGKDTISCPVCRQVTLLPDNGISGFLSAFLVNHLLDVNQVLEKVCGSQQNSCQKCNNEQAICYCNRCALLLCRTCIDKHNEWIADHQILRIKDVPTSSSKLVLKKQPTMECSSHGKTLEVYCYDCDKLICFLCTTAQVHCSHTYEPLNDCFPKHRKSIVDSLDLVEKMLAGITSAVQTVKIHEEGFLKQVEAIRRKIVTMVQQLIQVYTGSTTSSGETVDGYQTQNGVFSIGKISFSTTELLGKGSHGTSVFRGAFETQAVAVKRILPEHLTVADREIEALRESDQHPHVIRYFCTEQDANFRYIALELCQATLQEYVEGGKMSDLPVSVDNKKLLWQATSGLHHLHSLGIVHRDIKPQNVLLSLRPGRSREGGEVTCLISDFGLCRKLQEGRGSFTGRSGAIGTEGWIAPEVFQNNSRVTCAVDIFSLGCVFYYVLSEGSHPFGSPFHRQANIEAGHATLNELRGRDSCTAHHLVDTMISNNYAYRPTTTEVLNHCFFWSKYKQLTFFQEVSDRIRKDSVNSSVMVSLENGGVNVVKGNWKKYIGKDVWQSLRNFRTYQGTSVRDLLRALRNERHHYYELPKAVQHSLGPIPDGFVSYFTDRFPQLLIHTYKEMEQCSHETVFRSYY